MKTATEKPIMLEIKGLGPAGLRAFASWSESEGAFPFPEAEVFSDTCPIPQALGLEIDESRVFASRFEWGMYLADILGPIEAPFLYSPQADPLWSWLCAVWIRQLTNDFKPKLIRCPENYMIIREGNMARRVHRNAARTTFILAKTHGEYSRFILSKGMHVRGELTENLAGTKSYLTHKGFFELAHSLYVGPDGKPKRRAMSKPKNPADWTPGDMTGLGSVRRLITYLDRLYNTFDTLAMSKDQMMSKLPDEYTKFIRA